MIQIKGFTAEENRRVLTTYRDALESACRTFHGESRAAREVALIHAQITKLEIQMEKERNG